jgi:hypothetical protein
MIEKIRELTNKKYFHIAMIIVILAVILFVLGIILLKYYVEGETNMPFVLSKIAIISSSEGIDKETTDTKWAFDIYQSNDVYLYIDRNEKYGKTEIIKSIEITNFQIEAKNNENIKIYQPDEQEEKLIFKNKEENETQSIEYVGALESNLKQLEVSNQGGLVAFRCSNNNLALYTSDDEEINHNELLKKAGVTQDDLETKITFDLTIKLESGKEYKSTINLDFPIEDVIEQGTTSKEITDVKNFIFKRVNN